MVKRSDAANAEPEDDLEEGTEGEKGKELKRPVAGSDGLFGAGVFGIPEMISQLGMAERKAKEFVRDHVDACPFSKSETLFTKEAFRDAIERLSVSPEERKAQRK